jgi:hypothetical protein
MPGWIYTMTALDWVGMAATVAIYCVCAYRLGRNHETERV